MVSLTFGLINPLVVIGKEAEWNPEPVRVLRDKENFLLLPETGSPFFNFWACSGAATPTALYRFPFKGNRRENVANTAH